MITCNSCIYIHSVNQKFTIYQFCKFRLKSTLFYDKKKNLQANQFILINFNEGWPKVHRIQSFDCVDVYEFTTQAGAISIALSELLTVFLKGNRKLEILYYAKRILI